MNNQKIKIALGVLTLFLSLQSLGAPTPSKIMCIDDNIYFISFSTTDRLATVMLEYEANSGDQFEWTITKDQYEFSYDKNTDKSTFKTINLPIKKFSKEPTFYIDASNCSSL
jgi:hypothetical protein